MGNAKSTNKVSSSIDNMMSVVNNSSGYCIDSAANVASVKLKCSGSATCDVTCNVDQRNAINSRCAQSADTTTKLTADLTTKAINEAESISTFFSLSSSVSQNITELYLQLAQTIANTTTQTCSRTALNSVGMDFEGSDQANLKVVCGISQYNDIVSDCVLSSSAVNDIKQKIIQTIDQSANSEQKSLFGFISLIFIVIGIAIIAVVALVFLLLAFGVIGGKGKGSSGSSSTGMNTADLINVAAKLV